MKALQANSSGRVFDVLERQSEVDQLKAQLDKAKYDLAQTTVVAPADGSVANLALSKGDRASSSKAVLSFLVADAVQLVGIFSQNGYQAIQPGTRVQFALSNNPGHLYTSTIGEVVSGVAEGQIASSGELTRALQPFFDKPWKPGAATRRPTNTVVVPVPHPQRSQWSLERSARRAARR